MSVLKVVALLFHWLLNNVFWGRFTKLDTFLTQFELYLILSLEFHDVGIFIAMEWV